MQNSFQSDVTLIYKDYLFASPQNKDAEITELVRDIR
jgi:hypothetical protein